MKSRFAFLTLLAAALTLLSVTTLVQAQLIGARHPGPAPETEDEEINWAKMWGIPSNQTPAPAPKPAEKPLFRPNPPVQSLLTNS